MNSFSLLFHLFENNQNQNKEEKESQKQFIDVLPILETLKKELINENKNQNEKMFEIFTFSIFLLLTSYEKLAKTAFGLFKASEEHENRFSKLEDLIKQLTLKNISFFDQFKINFHEISEQTKNKIEKETNSITNIENISSKIEETLTQIKNANISYFNDNQIEIEEINDQLEKNEIVHKKILDQIKCCPEDAGLDGFIYRYNDCNYYHSEQHDYCTGLHIACQKGDFDYVKTRSSLAFSKDDKDIYGLTPLHYACESGSIDIVNLLIDKGANINLTDMFDNTPLHIAAKTGNKEIVELLISKGANKYSKNKRGRIPYDLATSDELKSLLK